MRWCNPSTSCGGTGYFVLCILAREISMPMPLGRWITVVHDVSFHRASCTCFCVLLDFEKPVNVYAHDGLGNTGQLKKTYCVKNDQCTRPISSHMCSAQY